MLARCGDGPLSAARGFLAREDESADVGARLGIRVLWVGGEEDMVGNAASDGKLGIAIAAV